jgi:hypothetical protein
MDSTGIPILPAEAVPGAKDGARHRDRAKLKRKNAGVDWEVDANGAPIPPL